MKPPRFLLGAVLVFWGWQTGLFYIGVALALLVEAASFTASRWELADLDFRRVWTLCTLLFLGGTIHAFVVHEGASGLASLFESQSMASRSESLTRTTHSVLALLQYLPLIFFPMLLAQVFSHREVVDLRSLSWWLRRRATREWTGPLAVNLGFPYFGLCLLAASTTNTRALIFYAGFCVLFAWALWGQRNRRFSPWVWALLLVVVGGIGYLGHSGLNELQRIVQNLDTAWLSRFSRHEVDGRGNRTFLGELGRLKMSGKILLRVTPLSEPAPELLREASYNVFTSPLWYTSHKEFNMLIPENDETTWKMTTTMSTSTQAVRIARHLRKGQGILPVPSGTWQLEALPVFILKSNAMGVLRVESGVGLVNFVASYGPKTTLDGPPNLEDQEIPSAELPALAEVVEQLGLAGKPPDEILQRVDQFFGNDFSYTTYLRRPGSRNRRTSPLTDFLRTTKAGHCEYFATATVLLLRQAGIPARYAVGYSVQEKKGDHYVVRERHAHSWCLAYVDGVWRDFDTTPPTWHALEADKASMWEPLRDWWSSAWFRFSEWRYSKTNLRRYALWLVIPPFCIVAVRLFYRRQWKRRPALRTAPRRAAIIPGKDSEFYLVAARMAELGFQRGAGEPLAAWIARVERTSDLSFAEVAALVSLHYRYRFDPAGLASAERSSLRQMAMQWLKQPTLQVRKNGEAIPASK